MANPWFRMYAEFANDPKVQMMTEADQRRFVMLLCMRCGNDSVTLRDEEVAFQLRISADEWAETKDRFLSKGLIDEDNQPTAWDRRQFISDSSATRVARHRAKRKAQGLTSQDYIPPKVRERVLKKHGGTCIYCDSSDDLTVDHKVPVQRGGGNEEGNLQPCCRTCNADKRNMTDSEYRAWNGRVTLLKRPQNTDTDTDTETDKEKEGAATPPTRAHVREEPPAAPPAAPEIPGPPEQPPEHPATIPDEAPKRATQLAVLLRRNGADPRTLPNDRRIAEWVRDGVTDAEALQALETAKARRKDQGSDQPIGTAYLAPIIADIRAAPPPGTPAGKPTAAPPDQWWRSDNGIDRKARELGMFARPSEDYASFKDRIFETLRQRESQGARA